MNGQILCALLAQRIPPAQFQVHGETVVFMDAQYDTPANQAIVADVVANYATLASAYSNNSNIDAAILSLEGKTERGVREAMLYILVSIAAAQGVTEPQLYAANYGYRKAKDLEAAIAALRAQRI